MYSLNDKADRSYFRDAEMYIILYVYKMYK